MLEWLWNTVDEKRVKNARKIKPDTFTINQADGSAEFVGHEGDIYRCSLSSCDCMDFFINNRTSSPCKHIIRLGMELGVINVEGRTPKQQHVHDISELKEQIARAAGYYHVFKTPIINNVSYDALKLRLKELEKRQ